MIVFEFFNLMLYTSSLVFLKDIGGRCKYNRTRCRLGGGGGGGVFYKHQTGSGLRGGAGS